MAMFNSYACLLWLFHIGNGISPNELTDPSNTPQSWSWIAVPKHGLLPGVGHDVTCRRQCNNSDVYYSPYAQCMVYLPTFGCFLGQM